ncbi:alpha/beta hydrolase [Actinomyces wuliandei]|uniref:alpha/beta fold hydrolase n=1 Tax=Actinomyces wuliandei TaxID=2057743 RepID=UPI00311AA90C
MASWLGCFCDWPSCVPGGQPSGGSTRPPLWPGLPEARQRTVRLARLLVRPGRWQAFQRTTRTDHRAVAPWLPQVTCPALIVMGNEDPDWKDPSVEVGWAAGAVGAAGNDVEVLMVPQAGHAPMLERPQLVAHGSDRLHPLTGTSVRSEPTHRAFSFQAP